jgi:hypothetical protein
MQQHSLSLEQRRAIARTAPVVVPESVLQPLLREERTEQRKRLARPALVRWPVQRLTEVQS